MVLWLMKKIMVQVKVLIPSSSGQSVVPSIGGASAITSVLIPSSSGQSVVLDRDQNPFERGKS